MKIFHFIISMFKIQSLAPVSLGSHLEIPLKIEMLSWFSKNNLTAAILCIMIFRTNVLFMQADLDIF